ncbi:MAG TPA: hypothetical protein VEB43_14585 [Anaeromyxobacter sp.]|nr:hypothetical protein [Anaeromyxobacter sp.]
MLLGALLPTLLAATIDVAPGADPAAAIAAARPDDTIRLAAGRHERSLGRVRAPIRIAGAGAGVTVVVAPEGEDGLVVEGGAVELEGLTLRASGPRSALKVLGGSVRANGVSLVGGALGAYVGGGTLEASDADLAGDEYGVLVHSGALGLDGARVRGGRAGVAQLGGRATLARVAVTGPSAEAGVTISGGTARLDDVVVRAPGPSGLAVTGKARVEAYALDASGAHLQAGVLGDCVQVSRAQLSIDGGTLTRCGGAALEAFGGSVEARGLDATGGDAGCLVFMDGADGRLQGNRCSGRGPAVVAASGAKVAASMNRWLADPVLWVECGSGARVYLGVGETSREPCKNSGTSLDKPRRK